MENFIKLTAQDGHIFNAYLCASQKPVQGAIIILHEIFGLTDFIKNMTQHWADEGYCTIAPSLYDRLEKNVVLAYDLKGYNKALEYKQRILAVKNSEGKSGWDLQLYDIAATLDKLNANYNLPINIIGFSWGGTLAWLSACRISGINRISAYYGTHIHQFIDEKPKCPVMLHCGEKDDLLTLEHVQAIHKQHPNVTIHTYPATHGFRCEAWKTANNEVLQYFDDMSSIQSDKRTHEFFKS